MDLYVLNDPDLCFKDILKRQIMGEPLIDKKEQKKAEEAKIAAEKECGKKDVKEVKNTEEVSKGCSDEAADKSDNKPDDKLKTEEDNEESKPDVEMETDESKPELDNKSEETAETEDVRKTSSPETENDSKEKALEEKSVSEKNCDNPVEDIVESDAEKAIKNPPEESESPKKLKNSEDKDSIKKTDEKSMPAPTMTPERRRVCTYIQPPQINIQQMEQMIAKGTVYDLELMNDLVKHPKLSFF